METNQGLDDLLAAAKATLERIKSLTTQVGLKYFELPEAPVGVGIAVAFAETQYTVLSVMGGGSEGQLNVTSGILRDIKQDRVTALSLCNGMVRDNPAYPIYLHDAPMGWDILVSNVFSIRMLFESPTFFANAVRALPLVADNVRPKFREANLGGQPFNWNAEDLNRLLLVSML
jgi:hypothetical protein